MEQQSSPSPVRLVEILKDRFGAFEEVANSSIKLARYAPEDELAMELRVAEAVLVFGSSLREVLSRLMREGGTACVTIARQPQARPQLPA